MNHEAPFMPPVSEAEAQEQAPLLKALADPQRLRLLRLLRQHEGVICVLELARACTPGQPTISHHLRLLREAGLVGCRKRGLWASYYVKREALERAGQISAELS
jgi:ArsR family transcriptional regulator